jgi:nucleoside-diphosphate-sugar epimerase
MVELLREKGYKVRATDLLSSNRAYWKEITQEVEFIPADLTKKETLKDVVKDVEYVFHPAAIFDYSASWELLERVNVFGTRNLLEAIVESNAPIKRFVNWSTAGVYGLPKPEILPVKEDAPTLPVDLYSKSKLKQEEVVMEFHRKYNIPVTIIRPSPIYGPRNIYGIAQVLLNIAKLPTLMVPKNFNTGMPFVHVKDVCNAALFLAQKEEANGEIYNVVDDSNINFSICFFFLSKK